MKKECTGILYRCTQNVFQNSNGEIIQKLRFRELKRKSCFCIACIGLLEIISEDVSYGKMPIVNKVVPNGLYKLKMVNIKTDHETGWVDDYDLEFKYLE